jgi:antitoxin component YwqK of YwqJK toxin-antitoxin module
MITHNRESQFYKMFNLRSNICLMKYISILLVSLIAATTVIAQENQPDPNELLIKKTQKGLMMPPNKTGAPNKMVNGKKDGVWEEHYYTIDNLPADTTNDFYSITNYKAGKPTGIVKMYHSDGKLQGEYDWSKGNEYGIKKEMYANGKVKSETAYNENYTKDGPAKAYYESGKLMSETIYKSGKENGTDKQYYENGKLKSETTYIHGTAGFYKTYDEIGTETDTLKKDPSVFIGYTNKREANNLQKPQGKQGKWVEYFDDHNYPTDDSLAPYYVLKYYMYDQPTGIERKYRKNGKLMVEWPWVNGVLNGVSKEYYENGKLKSETDYDHGVMGVTKNYDDKGKELK